MKLRIKPDPKIKNFLWPKYQTGGAAAFDIYLQEDISLRPREPAEISLGFSTEMDPLGRRDPAAVKHRNALRRARLEHARPYRL